MIRPEYSLSLDSVICRRCNTISRAEEDTCPQCGADRQGAIFTTDAEVIPAAAASVGAGAGLGAAAAAAAPMPGQLDIADLRDTGWLTRLARRRMVTSYPSLAEPGDLPSEPDRKPARKGIAMLVGGVVAGLAAGGYIYTQSDSGEIQAIDRPSISVAGPIGNGAVDAKRPALDESRESADRARLAASSAVVADAARSRKEQANVASASVDKKAAVVASTSVVAPATAVASTPPAAAVKTQTLASSSVEKPAVAPGTATGAVVLQAAKPAIDTAANAAKPAAPTVVASRNAPESAPAPMPKNATATATGAVAVASAIANKPASADTVATHAQTPSAAVPSKATTQAMASPETAPSKSATQAPVATAAASKAETHVLTAAPAPAKQAIASANAPANASSKTVTQVPVAETAANKQAVASTNAPANAPSKTTAQTPLVAARPTTVPPETAASKSTTQAPVAMAAASASAKQTTASSIAPSKSATQAPVAVAAASASGKQTTASTNEPANASHGKAAKPAITLASIEKPAPIAKAPEIETPSPAVARNIAAVQQALANRDLASARRSMRGLYSSQSRSPEIQQLAADVTRQERARDSAMLSARTCALNKDPGCAVRNARRAVAIDGRNPQTQALLRHTMAAQTEVNAAYFSQASAIPAPVAPAMTFDGRWSVSARHAGTHGRGDDDSRFTLFGLGVPTVAKGRGDAH